MAFINPLDFETLFLDYLAGNVTLLMILAVFFILYFSARFKFTLGIAFSFVFFLLIILIDFAAYEAVAIPLLILLIVVGSILGVIALVQRLR